jgi:RNA polymerase sigma-70 factor (ECF subfamily)
VTADSGVTLATAVTTVDERFAALYHDQFGPLVSFARTRVKTRADAEDIVQESFGNLWRRRHSVSRPMGYLWTSVSNGCRDDHRRAQMRRRYDPLLIDRAGHEPEYLTDLVAGLTSDRQQVLVRRFYRGDTLREIAEATDLPIGTVKSSLHRALADLRRSLDKVTP